MTLSFAPERIETWPLAKLQPYAKNAKAHGADQVAKIAASMAEFGWTVPCLVSEDGELTLSPELAEPRMDGILRKGVPYQRSQPIALGAAIETGAGQLNPPSSIACARAVRDAAPPYRGGSTARRSPGARGRLSRRCRRRRPRLPR